MKFSLLLIGLLACQAYSAPSSDSSILASLRTKKSATVIVSIAKNNVAELRNQFSTQSFATRAERLNSFYSLLKNHADTTQANILNKLKQVEYEKPIVVKQLWISNQIIIENADYSLVEQLLAMDEVAGIREDRIIPLAKPIDQIVHPAGYVPQADEPWGILAIHAPEAWANGNKGKGAVIGTIDTGVRLSHEALKDGHRTDYGWFDPYQSTSKPNDQYGHGTHTAGTIAGRVNGIGVAPEAQWITCKGCEDGCTITALLQCGQWMTCPTDPKGLKPDCSKAPNAVSNSWGGGPGDDFYDDVIDGWKANNIVPFFSIGNNGRSGCGTAGAPGENKDAIGVGATTAENNLADFSSKGPSSSKGIKPDIAAPGSGVYSSYFLSDKSYSTMSGTSMACPHAAGLAALLYGENSQLTYGQIRDTLIAGTQPILSKNENCGGISEDVYPNHHVGHGRIDAIASLDSLKSL